MNEGQIVIAVFFGIINIVILILNIYHYRQTMKQMKKKSILVNDDNYKLYVTHYSPNIDLYNFYVKKFNFNNVFFNTILLGTILVCIILSKFINVLWCPDVYLIQTLISMIHLIPSLFLKEKQ
jgi:hypothetical protein